jgi:hypothetical protein
MPNRVVELTLDGQATVGGDVFFQRIPNDVSFREPHPLSPDEFMRLLKDCWIGRKRQLVAIWITRSAPAKQTTRRIRICSRSNAQDLRRRTAGARPRPARVSRTRKTATITRGL